MGTVELDPFYDWGAIFIYNFLSHLYLSGE